MSAGYVNNQLFANVFTMSILQDDNKSLLRLQLVHKNQQRAIFLTRLNETALSATQTRHVT